MLMRMDGWRRALWGCMCVWRCIWLVRAVLKGGREVGSLFREPYGVFIVRETPVACTVREEISRRSSHIV